MGEFAVIGIGNFGLMVVKALYKSGHDVITIDKEKDKIQIAQSYSIQGVVADATDKEVLEKLSLQKMEAVVISLNKDVSASILTTLFLRDMGVKRIIAKATSEDHCRVLTMVGATEVIFPERDTAQKLVDNLTSRNILDSFNLSPEYAVVELVPPKDFQGKSIAELELRKKYHITVIAVRDLTPESMIVNPSPDFVIQEGNILIIIGKKEDVEHIK